MNKSDDQIVVFEQETEFDAITSTMDCTESIKFSPAKIGPLKLWLELGLDWTTADSTKSLIHNGNINFQNYHLGYTFDMDIATRKFSEVCIDLLLKNESGDYFINYSPLTKMAGLGCYYLHGSKAAVFCEGNYTLNGIFKGAFGLPAEVNLAGEYDVTESATVKASLNINSNWLFNYAWLHRVNKNLKVGFSHSLDVTEVAKGKTSNPLNFGTFVEWTL